MANITVSGTICKGNDKHEAIVARSVQAQQGQQTMTTFKVAVYQGKDRDGNSQYGYWKVTAFGILADNIFKDLKAGDRVTVAGQPKIERWKGQNGEDCIQPAITAQAVGREINPFPPRNSNGYGQSYGQTQRQTQQQAPQSMQDEFPLDFSGYDNPQDGGDVEIPF